MIPDASPESFLKYTAVYSLSHGYIFPYGAIGATIAFIHGYFRFIATFAFLLLYEKSFQLFTGMAGICVRLLIIPHIFTFTDVLFKTTFLPFFIGLWLDIRLLT